MEILGLHPRRLGSALLVFGAIGLALAIVGALVLGAAALSTASLNDRLEGSRVQLVASLQRAEVAIGHAADTTDHIGTSLDATRQTLATSSKTLTTLANATDGLASALLAVSILGGNPFASAGQQFQSFASQVRTYADHATQLSTSLVQNVTDMRTTASDLREIQPTLRDIATRLDALEVGTITTTLLLGLLVLVALTVWLGIGALACGVIGYRLRLRALGPVVVEGPAVIIPAGGTATEIVEVDRPPERRDDPRQPRSNG